MNIACLGWGSLVWDPRSIPIRGKWFDDGPNLPIEFSRESADGRITLVIADVNYQIRSLWILMTSVSLEDAKKALAEREEISDQNIKSSVGFWCRESEESHGLCADVIGKWAQHLNIDAVVWTNLKYGLKDKRGVMPSCVEIVEHLNSLPYERKKVAEEYVCKAPLQIDTEYRRQIQDEMGWKPEGNKNV